MKFECADQRVKFYDRDKNDTVEITLDECISRVRSGVFSIIPVNLYRECTRMFLLPQVLHVYPLYSRLERNYLMSRGLTCAMLDSANGVVLVFPQPLIVEMRVPVLVDSNYVQDVEE